MILIGYSVIWSILDVFDLTSDSFFKVNASNRNIKLLAQHITQVFVAYLSAIKLHLTLKHLWRTFPLTVRIIWLWAMYAVPELFLRVCIIISTLLLQSWCHHPPGVIGIKVSEHVEFNK